MSNQNKKPAPKVAPIYIGPNGASHRAQRSGDTGWTPPKPGWRLATEDETVALLEREAKNKADLAARG
jgi:hypothetical protein